MSGYWGSSEVVGPRSERLFLRAKGFERKLEREYPPNGIKHSSYELPAAVVPRTFETQKP